MYRGLFIAFAVLLFSLQLYMDFSGCMDIVLGVSKLFGIEMTENFRAPYGAVNVADFWRRWHMSLTSWFRDYLYIPLGGNRKGAARALPFDLGISERGISDPIGFYGCSL